MPTPSFIQKEKAVSRKPAKVETDERAKMDDSGWKEGAFGRSGWGMRMATRRDSMSRKTIRDSPVLQDEVDHAI